MRYSIGALSKRSGVSVRTLRYYGQIGLLQPSETAGSGYRYYDDEAAERLWQILFYRELGFSLRDIAAIVSSPGFDRTRAMEEHLALLKKERAHLDGLIALVDRTLKGGIPMEFKPFDKTELNDLRKRYAEEAKQRWGNTDAYRESVRRGANRSDAEQARISVEADEIFRAFAALVGESPADARVQALVSRWQAYLSAYYYSCTEEILAGLGQMYVGDARFTKNIDRFGEGTARLLSDARDRGLLQKRELAPFTVRRPRRANRSGAQRRPFTAAAQLVDKGGPLEAPPPNHRFEP